MSFAAFGLSIASTIAMVRPFHCHVALPVCGILYALASPAGESAPGAGIVDASGTTPSALRASALHDAKRPARCRQTAAGNRQLRAVDARAEPPGARHATT